MAIDDGVLHLGSGAADRAVGRGEFLDVVVPGQQWGAQQNGGLLTLASSPPGGLSVRVGFDAHPQADAASPERASATA